MGGAHIGAHRLTFLLRYGYLPPHVHHTCGVKRCVNPDHLQPLTVADHTRAHATERTHCTNGHEFTEANTYWRRNPVSRQCRACRADRARKAYSGLSPEAKAARVAYITERRRNRR